MLTTITECVVLEINIFCCLFDTLFCRFSSHITVSNNPVTESSIGKFFFQLWTLGSIVMLTYDHHLSLADANEHAVSSTVLMVSVVCSG